MIHDDDGKHGAGYLWYSIGLDDLIMNSQSTFSTNQPENARNMDDFSVCAILGRQAK